MDCRSFHHRSGYVEDDQQKAFDFEALYNWREDHQKIQSQIVYN